MKKIIKDIYLNFFRGAIFSILSSLTKNLRNKHLMKNNVENILIFSLNRIGDNILSTPVLRSIRHNFPNSYIAIISSRFFKDIFTIEGSVDKILFFRNENIFGKIKTLVYLIRKKWDLGIDLTNDYSFFPVFLLFIIGAKFRVGFNIRKRGFLFHKPIKWDNSRKHFSERLFDTLRGISLEATNDEQLKVPQRLKERAKVFLESKGINKEEIIIGIHPGGYYPSQRWRIERFARVAEEVIRKYKARVLIMDNNESLVERAASLMKEDVVKVCNLPLEELIGIISFCKLVICNNSGILNLACALNIPTISTMGPTISWQWWPLGENNIVLQKDLPCQSCEKGYCKTHECMDLISVEEMLQAVDKQINKKGDIKQVCAESVD